MHFKTIAACCGLAFAQGLAAAPADEVKALVEKGDPRAAYELARKHPGELGKPDFDFYYGVAALDSGRAGEGVLALERYVANFPDNARARLELARGYFVLGENARAREEFDRVLRAQPPANVTATIERYLDALRARESNYRTTTGAYVELGAGYDSNINGAPSSVLVIPGFQPAPFSTKTSSAYGQLAAGASVVHPVAPGVAVFGALSGDLRLYERTDRFDQGSLTATGGASVLREKDIFRASLSYSTLELNSERFRDTTAITGEWSRQLDELQAINAYLQWADLNYAGVNSVRDSDLYGLGAGWQRAFIGPGQPLLSLGGSYAREENRRGFGFLDRDIWGMRAALSVTPAPRWAVAAGATLFYSDYSDDPQARRDHYYAADVSVSYALTRKLSLRGELLFSRNDSSLDAFEYSRDVAAVKVRYEFK